MLSEKEKEKIRLTETCRMEVLEEIRKEKRKKWGYFRFLLFLDSKIVIWLLSMLFAVGGLKTYEDYKFKVTTEYNNKEAVDKLDLEIGNKFSRVFSALDEIEKNINNQTETTFNDIRIEVYDFILHTKQLHGTGGEYIYTEYAHKSLLSLMVEQRRKKIQLKQEVSLLDEVIAKISDLPGYFEGLEIDFSDIKALKQLISAELMLPSWKQYNF